MFRAIGIASLVYFLAGLCQAAPIQYVIGPSFGSDPRNRFALTTFNGTIVSDGKIGPLSESDIISWDWAAGGIDTNGSYWPLGNGSTLQQFPFDKISLIATPTQLLIPYPPMSDLSGGGAVQFGNRLSGPNAQATETFAINSFSPGSEPAYTSWGLQVSVNSISWTQNLSNTYPTSPFVFATYVPEPSSVVFLSLGAIGLAAVVRQKSRR